jgi:hypothetical protein
MNRENDESLDVIESIRANALLSEASEEFNTTEIKYPDSLVEIWKVFPNAERTKEEEEHATLVFRKLTTILYNKVTSHFGCESVSDKIYAVSDFLYCGIIYNAENKVVRPCPVSIQSEQALVRRMKKFLAAKNNPVGYELNAILREAIIALEKEGKVERCDVSGCTINSGTLFYLPGGSPDTPGTLANYQQKKNTIPVYRTEMRGTDWTKTRMISPSDAKKLILQILEAFGGAVRFDAIQQVAREHIPEQMWRIINESAMKSAGDNDNDRSILENIPDQSQDDSNYIKKFYSKQVAEQIVDNTSENIWRRITELEDGDRLFCLYFIPENFGESQDKKRKLSDFGAPQTVSDRNKKIGKIWQEEHKLIKGVKGCSRITGLQRKAVLEVFDKIFKKLNRRCTENGYNPGLSSSSGIS